MLKIVAAVAALALGAVPALAQSLTQGPIAGYSNTTTVMPMGGGFYSVTGSNGQSGTITPLGGGWSTYTGSNGSSATAMPMGGGAYSITSQPGRR